MAAQRSRQHYLAGAWLRYFGVTREELESFLAAVAQALEGGPLTREELEEGVTRLTGSAALGEKVRDGFGAMLKPAAFRGDLCFGPSVGQNVRFARPDRWLPAWQEPGDAVPALGEITRRYLAAYGPATRDDLARWWGAQPRQAGEWIAGLGDEVAPVQVGEARAWMLTRDSEWVRRATEAEAERLAVFGGGTPELTWQA